MTTTAVRSRQHRYTLLLIPVFLARRPAHVTAADQVQVQVKDRLAGARANIEAGTITVLDAALARDLRCHQVHVTDNLVVFRLRFL